MSRRAGLAFALATLFFGRQIAAWSDPENRFLYHWQRADGWYLIGAVLLLAAALLLVGELLRRVAGARVRRAVPLLFAVALGQVLVGLVLAPDAEKPFEGAQLASFTVLGLTLWWWRRHSARLTRTVTMVALLAVPLGPILFLQILTWKTWPLCGPPRAGPSARPGARPVYVLLFDEWSLARSEGPDGRFLPELVNLRRLAAMSTVYTEARAPGDATLRSIPRILYGENGEVVVGNGTAEWRVGDSIVPALSEGNLFRTARGLGYRTVLAGWYMPYAALVGGDLDWCHARPQVPKRAAVGRLLDLTWANLRHLPDPLARFAWRELHARSFSAGWYQLEAVVEREALRAARDGPDNTFAFFHFPLPHAPFIFGATGEYLGPFHEGRMFGTVAEYVRSVRYVDVVVGRFLDALRSAGRLESSVVVVTSDHSWKKDPDSAERTRERLRRVPLVVRWPGPAGDRLQSEPFCLLALHKLLEGPPSQAETQPLRMDCLQS